jgi:hypothetical protein
MIAAVAMIMDMTYEEVSKTIPLPDIDALRLTGKNSLGLRAFDDMKELAKSRGKRVLDFGYLPETLVPGSRYLGLLSTPDPLVTHTVAIDEQGIVLDPDSAQEQSHHWRNYDFMALLEFRPE